MQVSLELLPQGTQIKAQQIADSMLSQPLECFQKNNISHAAPHVYHSAKLGQKTHGRHG